ncbi:MAG: hypothetical protein GTO40_18575 [Deltaproteobacteria bacterium]|nr:hypothetical protein [Deltaproteobacteria bacterium]
MAKRAESIPLGTFPQDEEQIQKKMKEWNISREEFERLQRVKIERESRVTPPGGEAPDFELERLSPEGDRTGEKSRLSSFRGRPVALAFGSYT